MPSNKRLAILLAATAFCATLAFSQSAPLIHKQKYAMGTVFEIVAYDNSPVAGTVMEDALDEVVRLDHIMSDYKPESELSTLNRTANLYAQPVSPDLYRVIETSLRYSKLSGGKFDITVGPLVHYWKAVMRGDRAPSPEVERKLRQCVGYENLVLFPPDKVEFRCSTLQIDLGAIGKGYAVDRVVEILRSRGITNALINAGGSTLYGMGKPPNGSAWRVHLKDPSGKNSTEVLLANNSVSTSEQTASSLLGNSQAGHLIDPETAEPVKEAMAVSAVANTATDSDALSTTLFLLGPQRGAPMIKSINGASAIWISPSGEIKQIPNGTDAPFVRSQREQAAVGSAAK